MSPVFERHSKSNGSRWDHGTRKAALPFLLWTLIIAIDLRVIVTISSENKREAFSIHLVVITKGSSFFQTVQKPNAIIASFLTLTQQPTIGPWRITGRLKASAERIIPTGGSGDTERQEDAGRWTRVTGTWSTERHVFGAARCRFDFYFKLSGRAGSGSGRAGSGRGAPAAAGGQPGVSKPPKLLGLKISPVSRDERLHGKCFHENTCSWNLRVVLQTNASTGTLRGAHTARAAHAGEKANSYSCSYS